MPTNRHVTFVNNHYYHIFNRGVERRRLFITKYDYDRFLTLLSYVRYKEYPLRYSFFIRQSARYRQNVIKSLSGKPTYVSIQAYCLMPNHFHLLLYQNAESGITEFISRLANSYAKYFNTKNNREGPLFQGPFKAVHIGSGEQLIHVSRYIHLNPYVSSICQLNELSNYPWSSLKEYVTASYDLIEKTAVMSNFRTNDAYLKFVSDQADYAKSIKHYQSDLIDEENI